MRLRYLTHYYMYHNLELYQFAILIEPCVIIRVEKREGRSKCDDRSAIRLSRLIYLKAAAKTHHTRATLCPK